MMRSTAIGLAFTLLLVLASSVAFARGGGHMGGHMGGGHMGGGHWGGGHWGGHAFHVGGVHHFAAFHGARFHHHHGRCFVGVGYAAYDYGCWRVVPTAWGWRRVWVCGNPYYGYF